MKTKNMTTSQLRNSVNRSPLRPGFPPSLSYGAAGLLIPLLLLLTCFGLMPMAQAVGPDTDGAIAGSNNGEGVGVLVSRTTGIWNTGTGFEALNHLTSGNQNTATGLRALFSDTSGGFNTATGVYSLFSNTTGFFNNATGAYSLAHNTNGSDNTANGYGALYFNTDGHENTATGSAALYKNNTGAFNTAVGTQALFSNTTGTGNTANGYIALYNNTNSNSNTAVGAGALYFNTEGDENTATGSAALYKNTTGAFNTAVGTQALENNTAGVRNTANGRRALQTNTTGGFNTAIGHQALLNNTTGQDNTALGNNAGVSITGSGNVCIGASVSGEAAVDHTTYIRNVNTLTQNFSAGVNNYVTVRLSDGRLGHTAVVSSQRYKEGIKPLDKTSQALYALKPVSFRLKKELDPTQALGFGLIAEEVEKVDPDLVYRNDKGQVESVRYEMVNAMLLNEFLKEHRKIEDQQKQIDALRAQLKQQAALIQKVSAQIETSNPAPRVVANRP
jgi:hypothetical protein